MTAARIGHTTAVLAAGRGVIGAPEATVDLRAGRRLCDVRATVDADLIGRPVGAT